MKKLFGALLMVSFLACPCFAAAEDTMGLDLSLYANYWDVDDGDDNVWGPGLGLAIPLWNKQLKFDTRISWFEDAGNDQLGDIALYPLDLGLSWHQNCDAPWDYYALAGLSVVFSNADSRIDADVNLEDNALGGYVGAGARYNFAEQLGVFTNVYYRFVSVDADITSVGGLSTEGLTFDADGLNVDLGLAYTF